MYNRNQVIANKQQQLGKLYQQYDDNLNKMWQSPWVDYDECANFSKRREYNPETERMKSDINSLKRMNEAENNFNKNINLNDYRNEDGSFNVYEVKRPLNCPSGGSSFKSGSSKAFHQGVGIGNEQRMVYSDYGVNDRNLDVRFWGSNQPRDQWKDSKKVGTSFASNDQVKDIFFGPKSEEWTNHDNYGLLSHNCQHYTQHMRNNLMQYQNK